MENRPHKKPGVGDMTQTTPGANADITQPVSGASSPSPGQSSVSFSSSSIDHGRFLPGTMLAERYRVIELLGKGGMGEVYRADDLRLGQTVALKFLTTAHAGSINALYNEVRIARQVAHPNVCRVYDVGDVDGLMFISMEYIDGEHLGSLLKRIGRLSEDKAGEIAAQLCMGLAAIHDQGLIHRDLKPTNVMIDGRGKVRITDFGLAGLAADLVGSRERAGTPAYMAPEQIAGRGVTVRSDVYSLGLVLYELFTGKRAFEGKSWADFVRVHDIQSPVRPSSLIERIDPAIERAVMRCLEKDPAARPASAIAVAMSLPGGDPLRAAIAAGELPTPEAVAAGRAPGALPTGIAFALLVFVLLGAPLAGWLGRDAYLLNYTPLPKSPAVLADRAREMLAQLGYVDTPKDAKSGFVSLNGYREWLQQRDRSPSRWAPLAGDQPPAIVFWYRESSQWLAPTGLMNGAMINDPPFVVEGMIRLLLSPLGKLESLYVVPRRTAPTSAPTTEPEWSQLIALAGLNERTLTPADAKFVPPVYCDKIRSWRGQHPVIPDLSICVNAGELFGRPVYFDIQYDWEQQQPDQKPIASNAQELLTIVNWVLAFVAIGGAIALAWRNVHLGRSDRTGAWRVAFALAVASCVSWLVSADHFPSGDIEVRLLIKTGGIALLRGMLAWLLYLALEPAVRRRSPETLISWTRLLSGRYRDPAVGRDVLIGMGLGCLLAIVTAARFPIGLMLGYPPVMPNAGMLPIIMRLRDAFYPLIDGIALAVSPAMVILTLIVLTLIVVRNRVIAVCVVYGIATTIGVCVAWMSSEQPLVASGVTIVFSTLLTLGLVRGGLLVQVAALYTQNLIGAFMMWTDPGAWFFPTILIGYAAVCALSVAAMYFSLGGRPLLQADFLDR